MLQVGQLAVALGGVIASQSELPCRQPLQILLVVSCWTSSVVTLYAPARATSNASVRRAVYRRKRITEPSAICCGLTVAGVVPRWLV